MAAILPDSDSEDELPPGWEERATIDGSVYYVNHGTKGTQWTHPRTGKKKKVSGELPLGWEKVVEDDGKIVFVDHQSKQTTYTDPRLAFATEEKEFPTDIRQRFDASTQALAVLHGQDLTGRTAIITGANCGIGFETARSLALHGCRVVFACRSLQKAEEAIGRLQKEKEHVQCCALQLDLASLKSVHDFAHRFVVLYHSVDLLVLNAGVFAIPYTKTRDGFEMLFQVNHLSQFYLTLLLENSLIRAAPSRVVIVSSESHRFSRLSGTNISESYLSPESASEYWSMMAYNNSKLCNILFATQLASRWIMKGISVFALHPGNMVSSSISRHWLPYRLLFALVRPFTKSLQQAASTSVYCATATELVGLTGLYFNNCVICEPSKAAQDLELCHKLWTLSENMLRSTPFTLST